ncbi:MAG: cytochrome c-type biogenesis protein CcmH [Terriglobales bacterium]
MHGKHSAGAGLGLPGPPARPSAKRVAWRSHAGSRASLIVVLVLLAGSVALRGDGTFSPRAERIGKQLICTCGCQQGALVCTTLNCSVKLQMQTEIRQRSLLPEADSLVLQSFVQEYGTVVLADPTHQGFNETAWVMPWIILAVGLCLVVYCIRRFRQQTAAAATAAAGAAPPAPDAEQARIRAEVAAAVERDLCR